MKNKQKRKTHRWIWFVHEISSTMNSPWMQNKKYQSSASFVFRTAGAHRRVVHTLRLVENRSIKIREVRVREVEACGSIKSTLQQWHLIAVDCFFFWSGEIIPGSSAHWTRTRTKKKTQRQRRSARSKAMNYFRRKDPISGLSPHQDPRSAFRRRRNKGGDQSRLFLENGKQTEPQLMSTVSNWSKWKLTTREQRQRSER